MDEKELKFCGGCGQYYKYCICQKIDDILNKAREKAKMPDEEKRKYPKNGHDVDRKNEDSSFGRN